MKGITSLITYDREFLASMETALAEYRKSETLPIVVNGLCHGAANAYICESVAFLSEKTGSPILILVGSESDRDRICDALNGVGIRAFSYKERDLVFHNISASHDNERERLSVLSALINAKLDAVVATPAAAVSPTVPYEILAELTTVLEVGVEISPERLLSMLDTLGYARCDTVEAAGQFAHRGGIIDFFKSADEDPVRIEFFGDEIDRIVYFDPITQRAISACERVTLAPAIEVMMDKNARERVVSAARHLMEKASDEAKAVLKREIAAVEGGEVLDSRDKYLNIIYDKRYTLLDYFESVGRCVSLIVGTSECEDNLKKHLSSVKESAQAIVNAGLIDRSNAVYSMSSDEYNSYFTSRVSIHINSFATSGRLGALSGLFGFRTRSTVAYGGNPTMFLEDIKSMVCGGYRIIVECENSHGMSATKTLLEEEGYTVAIIPSPDNINLTNDRCIILTVAGCDGFDLIMPKIAVLSMSHDSGRKVMANKRRQRILRKSGGAGQRIMSYADLEVGDYVVHANYGIGLFEGMQSVRIDGVTRDYITIKYAGTDRLFVPCERLELIGKYIGARENDGSVKLSKMGGADWHKAKSRAKSAVKDIAENLIKLYAMRQRCPGYAFPPDSELEEEFAAGFEYEETDSQTVAIDEIKEDMMKPIPMNRLLCGDVGFGKTEVALRAAFKAIMGGKQVAILVPTTILALQHYQTATTRMRGYPVTVEMISRFKTAHEQAKIIDNLKSGKTDIIIGTHKLLGKQIKFKNLGLLIIDEEQRFGVAQKEKLKEMSTNIDVLTLSATPIPRTLNMAINGISDMSVLDEAPENRRPVQTYVLEHDDIVIYDAIRREMARGGQVLYLYNNIESISFTADKIAAAIPEARVAFAHGKMDKDELEDIWQMLVNSELDVLVCTTIIETGVDLPMANTLVIENADRMGLSQLHQIRGRVGRSERQAYAYFTYRPGKALTDIAKKRLSAIREYAEFGAGFKVALCDLEIRGAGNILGAEQHGYIDSVGYDLYVKLLSEAVLEEKGEKPPSAFESLIDIKTDAHIPEYYITKSSHRMEIYKKISLIRTPLDMRDVIDELSDRFGDIPKPTERLLHVALCRAIAEQARIPKISHKGNSILFFMDKVDLETWSVVLEKHRGKLFGMAGAAPIVYKLKAGEEPIFALSSVLEDYYKEMNL